MHVPLITVSRHFHPCAFATFPKTWVNPNPVSIDINPARFELVVVHHEPLPAALSRASSKLRRSRADDTVGRNGRDTNRRPPAGS